MSAGKLDDNDLIARKSFMVFGSHLSCLQDLFSDQMCEDQMFSRFHSGLVRPMTIIDNKLKLETSPDFCFFNLLHC